MKTDRKINSSCKEHKFTITNLQDVKHNNFCSGCLKFLEGSGTLMFQTMMPTLTMLHI